MNRRELLKICGLLGISVISPMIPHAFAHNTDFKHVIFSGNVLIIGAGAAGMSAGYLLEQRGIDFTILESSHAYGGRMKRTNTFSDFPIPLGAEWLHVKESILKDIVNDANVKITTQTQGYNYYDRIGYYNSGMLMYTNLGKYADRKFIGSTWFDFFDEYVVSNIHPSIKFNTQIVDVDYRNDKIILTDSDSVRYEADKVLVTVPLKILQDGDVQFIPKLPRAKLEAIDEALVWGGIKVFMEFTEKFYPTELLFTDSETNWGQRLYYDAAYAQNTNSNILGLFAVGEQALQYQAHSGIDLKDYILNELDEIFSGIPSRTFVKHIVQNWSEEPFIRSAYLADVVPSRISSILSTSVEQKIFFAGEAYTQEDDWGGVHNAVRSARDAVHEILL